MKIGVSKKSHKNCYVVSNMGNVAGKGTKFTILEPKLLMGFSFRIPFTVVCLFLCIIAFNEALAAKEADS